MKSNKEITMDVQRLDWINGEPVSVYYKKFKLGPETDNTNEFRVTIKSPKGNFYLLVDGNGSIKFTTEYPYET